MIRRAYLAAGLVLAAAGIACPAEPIDVAAFYFPGYHPTPRNDARLGKGWTEWDLVKAARPRFPGHAQPKVPLWGYEDESDPAAMAKKIDAAADHGVTAFIFDWYWHEEGPFLDGALEKGFLRAANRSRLKFCVMWANHDWIDIFPAKAGVPSKLLYPGAVSRETFDRATDHAIRAYFSQPNHWKIDGRPVFSIYETMTLVKGLGGMEKTREALDGFRARARAAGFPGIHLNGVAWGIQPAGLASSAAEMVRALGIDSVTSYCWIHHTGPEVFPATPYAGWARKSMDLWPKFRREWPVPYFPNVSMGWDSSPRTTQSDEFRNAGYPYTPVLAGNTPDEFRKALEEVRKFLEGQDKGPRAFTINAWNEWTEGSYLEPDATDRFAYLEAIRAVFGKPAPVSKAGRDAFEQKDRLGRGMNAIGYDPIWKDRSRARFQEEHFRLIREAGFRHVRINLHPFRDARPGDGNLLSEAWLGTLDWAVDKALAAGLLVVLDFHEFTEMSRDPDGKRERFLAMWGRIAERCKDRPDSVLFEILNEPHDKLTPERWNVLLREALAVIRKTNPYRTVIVGPGGWNSIGQLEKLDLPADDRNIIVTVHYYSPFEFTHQGAPWTDRKDKLGVSWTGTPAEREAMARDFDKASAWAGKERRPIYLGEFGAYDKAELGSRVRYISAVAREAERRGWCWAYWQFDGDFIAYDIPGKRWVAEIRDALIPAAGSATAPSPGR